MRFKNCVDVINDKRAEIGITTRSLATKAGIEEAALGATFNHKRRLLASELLALSKILNLDLSDYAEPEISA